MKAKSGLQSRCQECQAKYYAQNREARRAKGTEWYQRNKEAVLSRQKRNAQKDPEKRREQRRKTYLNHRDTTLESNARWRKEHPEEWRLIRISTEQRRRAKKRSQDCGCMTLSVTTSILSESCVYCGEPSAHIDHVIPLSAGGAHCRTNTVPACARCNMRKREFPVERLVETLTDIGIAPLVNSTDEILHRISALCVVESNTAKSTNKESICQM